MPTRGKKKLDWDKLRVFHAVAEAGSFTHASEILNLSQSAASRQISALEDSIGGLLFHRHARGLLLTEKGEILYEGVHEVFARLNAVESTLTETTENMEGPLTVTTTVAFGSVWLTPRLREFIRSYPDIKVNLRLDDRQLDLAMRQADVAIRFHEPTQPDLIRRSLGSMRIHLYASPEYLRENGVPQTTEDIKNHQFISFGEGILPFGAINTLQENFEKEIGDVVKTALKVNNLYGIYRAVRSGIGIGALPEYFYREGRNLVQVMPDISSPEITAYFCYPIELRNSRRIAVFRDYLLKELTMARAQLKAL